ncbi:cytochrome P450 [Nonomuraea sp. NPDC004297]
MTIGTDVPAAAGAVPLLGHTLRLLRDPLGYLEAQRAADPLVRLRLGRRDCYLVNRTDLAVRALTTQQDDFDKGGPFMEAARLLVGNGIITCDADDHRGQLPLLQPAFHRRGVEGHAEVMRRCVQEVVGSWTDGSAIAVGPAMHRLSSLVIARTLVSAPTGHRAAAVMAETLPVLLRGLFRRMLLPPPWPHRLPTPANRRFAGATARLDAAIAEVVAQYRGSGEGRDDLLSRLVGATSGDGRRLTDREIRDQVMSLLSAGIETTATLLTWTCHVLARNDEVAANLRAEVDRVASGCPPAFADLAGLRYTKAVLTEALRLYPPTWILSRQAIRETGLGGYAVPDGGVILISPFALHRDPGLFPDPGAFRPERWLSHDGTARPRQSLLAFGGGRRRCLGELFGLTEATLALAAVVSRWDLRPVRREPPRTVPRMLLVPEPQPLLVRERR